MTSCRFQNHQPINYRHHHHHQLADCRCCRQNLCSCPLRSNINSIALTTIGVDFSSNSQNMETTRRRRSASSAQKRMTTYEDGSNKSKITTQNLVSTISPQISSSKSSCIKAAPSHHNRYQNDQIVSLRLVLLVTATLFAKLQLISAANQADQAPIFSSNGVGQYNPPTGPSLCPLVTSCHCKWAGGKQAANCERRNLSTIPNQLPQDTQILEMNGNNLNQLGAHIFQEKHLTNLQKIRMADCKIATISNEAFAHLTNLIELDISNNNIQQVPVKSFEHLKYSLRKLSLARNQIQVIESEAFSSLTHLNTLDLNGNQLSQLKPNAFHGLSHLKELHLHNNRLTQLPMNVLSDLSQEYLIIDLYSNPWHCDCELRQSIEWMTRHHIQQSIIPTCATPQRVKDIRWHNVKPEEYICPPSVLNKQTELVVGAGSNVSLACTARGSPPLTFVWFQDEKNLTTGRPNVTDPPASTKLLEESRYEIAEELSPPGPPGQPNMTTSILYLFNLKLSDTSLFLCWVENAAGYTIANFSLVVNDSPPAHLTGATSSTSPTSAGNYLSQLIGLSRGEAQLGLVSILFVALLVAAAMMLLIFKRTIKSSKRSSSQSSENLKKSKLDHSGVTVMGSISANKFSAANSRNSVNTMDSDDQGCDDEEGEDYSSSGSASSCRKNPKVMATGDLDGFIEHMRSGIINMDYHSMSPVIQFNQNQAQSKQANGVHVQQQQQQQLVRNQQPLQGHQKHPQLAYLDAAVNGSHHFASVSNASSVPYYGNGSTSMATTTSDLSPSCGSGNANFNQANNGPQLTNCDLQNQLNDMAPPTNTTTTSYTSDYQSGYSEQEPTMVASMMPPMYYETGVEPVVGGNFQAQPGAAMFSTQNGPLIMGQQAMRPNSMSFIYQHQQHQLVQGQPLVLQDMAQSRQQVLPNNQRPRYESGFRIL